ncbi:hypothetical protein [Streptomyces albus]|uniref:hypothetical protein n=1 Tax=Streptomyces albus TaxID=1888 RepID=UPI001AEC5F5E|nr:hypothetical protein [Streptomyces albus]UVN53564.1 hypothetical protein NR995_02845 [Streptomyces albus]
MLVWMRSAPRPVAATVCVIAAGLLLVGAVTHIADLLRHGLAPYAWAPAWLNLYWSALALLDPLAAVLLLGGRRRGSDLACGIMITDVAANWYAVHGIQHSSLAAQPGLQRLLAFAALVLVTAPVIRRHLPNRGLSRKCADAPPPPSAACCAPNATASRTGSRK